MSFNVFYVRKGRGLILEGLISFRGRIWGGLKSKFYHTYFNFDFKKGFQTVFVFSSQRSVQVIVQCSPNSSFVI